MSDNREKKIQVLLGTTWNADLIETCALTYFEFLT